MTMNCPAKPKSSPSGYGSIKRNSDELKSHYDFTVWGFLHIPAERFNSDHTAFSGLVLIRISANFRRISSTLTGLLAVYGTRSVRLERLYLATFKDDETLS